MRDEGTLQRLEDKWLGEIVDPLPAVPNAEYRD